MGIGGSVASAASGEDRLATAEASIEELTAALPGVVPVQGGGQHADVPACDVVAKRDALAAEGTEFLQAYGGEPGGAVARIVVLDSKKTAKRLFKLVTSDDAEGCTLASIEAGMAPALGGATAVADLASGRLDGLKKSFALEGTITLGDLKIQETDVAVWRGPVVIQGNVGAFGDEGPALTAAMADWLRTTAGRF